MLGKVTYVTPDTNNQPWMISASGFDFEDYIASIIENSLIELYDQGLLIERTPRTRDSGKDLIITSPVSFSLFGKKFRMNEKGKICIYIEFKSSKNSKIQLEHFSKNILLANGSEVDYFVLITNKTIVPFSYYEADRNAHEYGYQFYLVDQYCLFNALFVG